ncbi:MAG: molybdopterin-binding protein, partial [Thermoanaerobaculia bacterium]
TTEVVEPLLDTLVEGFGELFRMLSWEQVGAAAMLSRTVAGLIGERAVFVLPGSPKAVELGMEQLILPEAAHLLSQVEGSD